MVNDVLNNFAKIEFLLMKTIILPLKKMLYKLPRLASLDTPSKFEGDIVLHHDSAVS